MAAIGTFSALSPESRFRTRDGDKLGKQFCDWFDIFANDGVCFADRDIYIVRANMCGSMDGGVEDLPGNCGLAVGRGWGFT